MKKSMVAKPTGQLVSLFCILFLSLGAFAQDACTYTWTSGNSESMSSFIPANWSCVNSGAAFYTAGTYSENLTIGTGGGGTQMGNGDVFTMNFSFTLNGNITINANAHSFVYIPSGVTVTINGNLTDANNNVTFNVDGVLIVNGTLTANNSVTFTGSGSISGTTLVTGANPTCSSCPGLLTFQNCSSGDPSFCSGNVLPITLVYFKASVKPETVLLAWGTDSEINFDYFVLEKSSNGTQFSEIARIKGSRNSNTRRNYSYIDNNPFIGNAYYRLTSVDFDGYTEVFNNSVVQVTVKAEKHFSVAPNPVQSFRLKGSVNFENAHGSVVIFDRMGSVIAWYAINDSEIDVQLPMLSSGVYFAQLQSGEFSKTVRFAVNEQ